MSYFSPLELMKLILCMCYDKQLLAWKEYRSVVPELYRQLDAEVLKFCL